MGDSDADNKLSYLARHCSTTQFWSHWTVFLGDRTRNRTKRTLLCQWKCQTNPVEKLHQAYVPPEKKNFNALQPEYLSPFLALDPLVLWIPKILYPQSPRNPFLLSTQIPLISPTALHTAPHTDTWACQWQRSARPALFHLPGVHTLWLQTAKDFSLDSTPKAKAQASLFNSRRKRGEKASI